MREQLKAALAARHPAIADNLIDRYLTKYVAAVMAEIATRLHADGQRRIGAMEK